MGKPFFVGQRSLRILQRRGPRQVLVGLEFADSARMAKESHLLIDQGDIAGRITSIGRSATLQKVIALALVTPQRAAASSDVQVRIEGGEMLTARIVPTPFYDPKQQRQQMEVA